MKLRHILVTGIVGLSLAASEAFTQPPSGGRGSDRGVVPAGPGGAPGGFGGGMPGGFGGGRGFGSFDPNQMFDRMAQGRDVIVIAEQDPRRQQFLNMMA